MDYEADIRLAGALPASEVRLRASAGDDRGHHSHRHDPAHAPQAASVSDLFKRPLTEHNLKPIESGCFESTTDPMRNRSYTATRRDCRLPDRRPSSVHLSRRLHALAEANALLFGDHGQDREHRIFEDAH